MMRTWMRLPGMLTIATSETHVVGQKGPNAWGLYDMLGNVDEWCHDGRRDYEQEAVVDPVGPLDAGALRVIRGGSWLLSARLVRAAYRVWRAPGDRSGDLGFRCASSSVSQPGAARATWSESQRQAEPAKTATRMPAARLLNLQRQPSVTTGLPDGEGFSSAPTGSSCTLAALLGHRGRLRSDVTRMACG